ncbi:Peptidase family M28 [Catalinimonas alkaloidigena]|uniref:Peptidase family M28 n=1 Tax=Catalinimonas alkaloidigena TaxID=1075417 RepID=A0A1G9AW96_9BACT|nr:M20/M25/M40 family metallo-hydrolase [Catalinimonas alkaloidigena]SDK31503.1 Peptidase family M28 [Catalinimonas alkaloidigena]
MKHFFSLLLLFLSFSGYAQTAIVRQDPAIQKMVEDVSAENIEAIVRKLVSFGTRHTLSDTTSKKRGIGAARAWIKSEMERYATASNGRLQVTYDAFVQPADGRRVPQPTTLKNVLATLKGTDPNDPRIYIVSGHYDSRASDVMDAKIEAPGANDDASGTAVAMELARVMSQRSFPATIIFVAMVGEEQGLYGATHLAERAREEGWHVDAMITNDIVGNSYGMETGLKDNRSVRVFSEGVPAAETEESARIRTSVGGENDSPAREVARYMKEVGERYVPQLDVKLIYRRDRYLRGGDHTPFSREGFAAVRVTEMNEDFTRQHQDIRTEEGVDYGDLPDFVDYDYTQKVARMNLATLANLASAPGAPQQVGIVTANLTNRTTLRWEAPEGKAPAGYYVLMRETTSPFWEQKFYVTGTEDTLDYSKDNYFFAVQSVDAAGHESLPVFPNPMR